jgi:glycerol-3-phosphate dehydrogenase (NAD(P)+)
MKITILGSGMFGTALSCMFRENKCKIKIWDKFDSNFDNLRKKYPDTIFTTNLKESLIDTDLIVIAIPISFLEENMIDIKKHYQGEDILIASKGININDGLLAHQIIKKYIKPKNIGAISGGTFAIDMQNKKIMGLTLGTTSAKLASIVKENLSNKYLKVQYTNDLIGVEVCGSIKNIMAIGFGILDGAGYPESTRFFYLTKSIYEIDNLIQKLNGNKKTIMTYAGIDDIMMTCTSDKSRNYSLGKLIGKDKDSNIIKEYKENNTIEGYDTALAIYRLCQSKNINLPICNTIYEILYNNKSKNLLIEYLEKVEQ